MAVLVGFTLFAGCGRESASNVLLITVDALRADRLGYQGHSRSTSPAIDRLAAQGLRFERFYSQAGWTLPSMATMMTGLYPAEHGASRAASRLRADRPTLATLLAEKGFETRAYVSQGFLLPEYGFDRGFGHFDSSVLEVGKPQKVATARRLTDLVLEGLPSLEEPFFVWVHYFDPHADYLGHRRWRFGRRVLDRYDSEIAYTDNQIGRLLEAFESAGRLDDTVVVLTADHGEEFREHGGRQHRTLFEEVVRVPMILRAPGVEPGVVAAAGSQIDILPTVLHLLEIEPPGRLPGRPLTVPGRERPVLLERERPLLQQVVIWGDRKLYRARSVGRGAGKRRGRQSVPLGVRLYDLAMDPGELEDLYGDGGAEAARLLAHLDVLDERRLAPEAVELDPEQIERLRSLGYFGKAPSVGAPTE